MTRFNVVKPISPDRPFGDIKTGELFQTKYSNEVWMKISPVWILQIDNPSRRIRQDDEREIVTKVLLEREDIQC